MARFSLGHGDVQKLLTCVLLAATHGSAAESGPPSSGSLSLRAASTNRYESLSLKPRTRSTNTSVPAVSTVVAPNYLEAWRAAHPGVEPSEDVKSVDDYLRSKPDPRALRWHLQGFIQRRPGTWLASAFPEYPSTTGDRAGAWKRIFPELVSPDNDPLQRQVAFDALLQLFEGTPEQKALHEQLARHAQPGMLVRGCRSSVLSGALRKSLTPGTLQRLAEVEARASRLGMDATASVLALHAHLLGNTGLPEPKTLAQALKTPTDPGTPADRAQRHAARLVAALWPPLSVSGIESPRMHDLLSRTYPFTELRIQKVFGLVPGTLEQQTAAILSTMPPGSPELALGGQPPRLRVAGLGDTATWSEQEGSELDAQIERVRAARKAEAEAIRSAGWARRFHNPEGYERQLAELRGESVPFINSTTLSQAQSGLAAVESYRGERMRDGVVVGRDPNRFDRVYTRELNSFERRELDFQIDVERRRVEDARLNDQYNQRMLADYQARERAILERLNEANRIVRDSEREWASRLRTLRTQVESEEAKLRNLRGVGVPAAEIEARHDAIRIAELKQHRAQRIQAVRAWESEDTEVTSSEAGAERLWRRWLTVGEEPEYVPQVIGGFPLP